MSNPTIKIVELDGTEIERPMTDDEAATLHALRTEWDLAAKAEEDAAKLKSDVLAKLGLTFEEAASLLK